MGLDDRVSMSINDDGKVPDFPQMALCRTQVALGVPTDEEWAKLGFAGPQGPLSAVQISVTPTRHPHANIEIMLPSFWLTIEGAALLIDAIRDNLTSAGYGPMLTATLDQISAMAAEARAAAPKFSHTGPMREGWTAPAGHPSTKDKPEHRTKHQAAEPARRRRWWWPW